MNIVFIGMPGSGKTTIGKLVADKLNKKFYDLDNIIEQGEGKSIKEIFENGEDYFRNLEYKYSSEIIKKNDIVIATGGGTIIREDSVNLIKDEYVIFLDRSIHDIISNINNDDRPLLVGNIKKNLERLYDERIDIYESVSNYKVIVKDLDETVFEIIEHLKRGERWRYYLYLELI